MTKITKNHPQKGKKGRRQNGNDNESNLHGNENDKLLNKLSAAISKAASLNACYAISASVFRDRIERGFSFDCLLSLLSQQTNFHFARFNLVNEQNLTASGGARQFSKFAACVQLLSTYSLECASVTHKYLIRPHK